MPKEVDRKHRMVAAELAWNKGVERLTSGHQCALACGMLAALQEQDRRCRGVGRSAT